MNEEKEAPIVYGRSLRFWERTYHFPRRRFITIRFAFHGSPSARDRLPHLRQS
jgi:hypothetical protein